MTENIMDSILGIELTRLTIDGPEPSDYIMIQTKRRKYAFKLSENAPENAYKVFKLFVDDLNNPVPNPTLTKAIENEKNNEKIPTWEPGGGEDVEKPIPVEKHDGANLLDVPPRAPSNVEIEVRPSVDVATQD